MGSSERPNILFIMCDQFRYDAISAWGKTPVPTPNIDRLVERGISCTQAYSACPVCIPARYVIRSGCEPPTLGCFYNTSPKPLTGNLENTEERCGEYLPRLLSARGYRTFGIGKFHTHPDPYEDLGYEVHIHTEELWETPEHRAKDGYIRFLKDQYPSYSFLEQPHGERTNMYYMPQMRAVPQEATVEEFVTGTAVTQLSDEDERPYFGMVSFIGPHPPCAPPIPYNRMLDPDDMDAPIDSDIGTDHMDAYLPWMNRLIWADEMNDFLVRSIKSRYYGEIAYLDACIGRILDAVEKRDDAAHTMICFFSDHGDHLGDHHAWQKESFFESSTHVPFLVSWPDGFSSGVEYPGLVSLADLFCLATGASGETVVRDGEDLLSMLCDEIPSREYLYGYHGRPGTREFKMMVRTPSWKYIFMSNGGREQLFSFSDHPEEDRELDTNEIHNLADRFPEVCESLKQCAERKAGEKGLSMVLDDDGRFRIFEYEALPSMRIRQFDRSQGIDDFILHQ